MSKKHHIVYFKVYSISENPAWGRMRGEIDDLDIVK